MWRCAIHREKVARSTDKLHDHDALEPLRDEPFTAHGVHASVTIQPFLCVHPQRDGAVEGYVELERVRAALSIPQHKPTMEPRYGTPGAGKAGVLGASCAGARRRAPPRLMTNAASAPSTW